MKFSFQNDDDEKNIWYGTKITITFCAKIAII